MDVFLFACRERVATLIGDAGRGIYKSHEGGDGLSGACPPSRRRHRYDTNIISLFAVKTLDGIMPIAVPRLTGGPSF
jgi:phosphatidylethanolamine-binding protein (PEBP) family uncharacterized protein